MSDVRRDYPLDDYVDVDTPARMKALGDPLRMHITELVLERAMSVTELARRLGRPKGTVAYHVDILQDAGLLQVVHTRRVRAVDERFYGRVARTYVFHDDVPGEIAFLDQFVSGFDHDLTHDERLSNAGLVTLRHARIPVARVEEYRERLLALAHEFVDEPRAGDIEFGMYLALYPAARRASAREQSDE